MNREKKLLKNTVIISIGKVCTSLLTFFLLPLYTSYLSTGEYGIVDLLTTLTTLLLPIVTFQIEKAVFRELIESRNDEEQKSIILSTSFLGLIWQCILLFILFFIISSFVDNKYKFFLVANVISHIISSFLLQVARGVEKTSNYSIGSFISAILCIVFNIIFIVIFDMGVYGMLLGMITGPIIASIYLFISLKLYKYIKLRYFNKIVLRQLLKYSVPLIPNALSWWVFSASDKFIVSLILGVDANGILAAALKFSSIITIIYGIFDTSWVESISVNINDEDIDEYFNRILNIALKFFGSLVCGLIACMPFIFPIMINEKFSAGYGLVPISILSVMFNVLQGLVVVVYAAKKDTKAIAQTSIVSAIINITVHLLLIKIIGLYAAVLSTLVAFVTMSIYRTHHVNKNYIKVRIEKKFIISFILIVTTVMILYYINNIYLNVISVLLAVIYAILINKQSLNELINLFFKRKNKS